MWFVDPSNWDEECVVFWVLTCCRIQGSSGVHLLGITMKPPRNWWNWLKDIYRSLSKLHGLDQAIESHCLQTSELLVEFWWMNLDGVQRSSWAKKDYDIPNVDETILWSFALNIFYASFFKHEMNITKISHRDCARWRRVSLFIFMDQKVFSRPMNFTPMFCLEMWTFVAIKKKTRRNTVLFLDFFRF